MNILILGGNRFFGLHLAKNLLQEGHQVTLLNRGKVDDGLGRQIERIQVDRRDRKKLEKAVEGKKWDIVFDQVCYTATEAREACEIFASRAGRYVVTSSESVFDNGANQPEINFDPLTYTFSKEVASAENYKEAKRQMEVVFTESLIMRNCAIVRPSLVVGLDDYTGRLLWHVKRTAEGLPMYFPDLDVETDFILSQDMGMALKTVGFSSHTGPVNTTSHGSIRLRDLIQMCERATGKKAVFADSPTDENHSPYGGDKTKTMNCDLLAKLGYKASPSQQWIENLIRDLAKPI
jgi:nucleoside-diphosphate-sugar epimerase